MQMQKLRSIQGQDLMIAGVSKASTLTYTFVTILFIATLSILYFPYLTFGKLYEWDEYLALDRASSVLRTYDFLTIYTGNLPSFKKPPLQYWLGAASLATFAQMEFAMRLPSFLFAVMTLASVAALAFVVSPSTPVAIALAVLFLAVSDNFWTYAVSAMLDTGAAFFGTLAVLTVILAIKNPKYWYLCAIVVWLGALQKAPVGFLYASASLLILAATSKFHDLNVREIVSNTHFKRALGAALILMLLWPAVQILQFGEEPIKIGIVNEMVERFSPVALDSTARDKSFVSWLVGPEKYLWLPAIASLFIGIFFVRTWQIFIVAGLALLFFILMFAAGGKVYDRYLLVVLPLLAVNLAVVLATLTRYAPVAAGIAAVLLFANGPVVRDMIPLMQSQSPQDALLPLFESVRATPEGKQIFVTNLNPGAVSYYASDGRAVYRMRGEPSALLKRKNLQFPITGINPVADIPDLERIFDVTMIKQQEGYVHWMAKGPKSQ
jgi:4-amino-4-deoxy-L-arabinose transferase-like glycosyltransferase